MESFMESTQVIFNSNAQHAFAEPDSRRIPDDVVAATLTVDGVDHVIYNRENKLGRSDICDVVIKSKAVSTVHATIDAEDASNHFICDLNSTNSTKLGSAVLKPRVQYFIKNGETITFANVTGVYKYVEREKENEALPSNNTGEIIDTSNNDKNDGSDLIFDTPLKAAGGDSQEIVPSSSPVRDKSEVINPLIFDLATQPYEGGYAESPASGVSSVFDMMTEPPFPMSENLKLSEPEVAAIPEKEEPENGDVGDDDDDNDVTVVTFEPVVPIEGIALEKTESQKSGEETKAADVTVTSEPVISENVPEKTESQKSVEETKADDVTSEPVVPEDVPEKRESQKSDEIKSDNEVNVVTSPVKPVCFNIVDDPSVGNLPNKKRFAKNRLRIVVDVDSEETNSSDFPPVQTEVKVVKSDGSENSSETAGFHLSCLETQAVCTSEANTANQTEEPAGNDIYSMATQLVNLSTPCDNSATAKEIEIVPAAQRSSLALDDVETQLVVKKEESIDKVDVSRNDFAEPQFDSTHDVQNFSELPTQCVLTKVIGDGQPSTSGESLHLNLSELPTQIVDPSRKPQNTLCDSQFPLNLALSESEGVSAEVSYEVSLSEMPTQAVKRIETHLEGIAEVETSDDDDGDDIIPCSQPVEEEKPLLIETNRSQSSSPVLRTRAKNVLPLPATQPVGGSSESSRSSSPVLRTRSNKVPPLPATQTEYSRGMDPEVIEEEDADIEFCSPVLRTTPRKLLPLPDTQEEEPVVSLRIGEIIDETETIDETVIPGMPGSEEVIVDSAVAGEQIVDSNNLIINEASNPEIDSEKTPRQFVLSDDENEDICMTTPTRVNARKEPSVLVSTTVERPVEETVPRVESGKLTGPEDEMTERAPAQASSNIRESLITADTTPSKLANQRASPSPATDELKSPTREKPNVAPPSTPKRPKTFPTDSPTSPTSSLESPDVNSSIFGTAKDKPRVKKYFNRNKMSNSFSFLMKEPAATSTPVRFAGFDDSPSGKVYESPDKSPDPAKQVVTLFSDTVIPPANTLKPNGRKSSNFKKILKDSTKSSGEDTDLRVSSTSVSPTKKRSIVETSKPAKSDAVVPKRGRPAKKGKPGPSTCIDPLPDKPVSGRKETRGQDVLSSDDRVINTSTSSKSKEDPPADTTGKRGARRKPLETPPTPTMPPPTSLTDPQLSSPKRTSARRSPMKRANDSQNSSVPLNDSDGTDEYKVPSRSVTDLSSDTSEGEDFVQKRIRRPPIRIMDDSFQPIPFVPSNRSNPKTPSKTADTPEPNRRRQLKKTPLEGAVSTESQDLGMNSLSQESETEPVKKPGRQFKRLHESENSPGPKERPSSPGVSTETPSKRSRVEPIEEPKLRGRRAKAVKTEEPLPTKVTQNSQEQITEPNKSRTRGGKVQHTDDIQPVEPKQNPAITTSRGRRGKPDDSQPTVIGQQSQEEPKALRRGIKNREIEDSQPTQSPQNSQEDSETRGRRAKLTKADDVQPTTNEVSHEEPKAPRRGMKNRVTDDSQPTQVTQNSQDDPQQSRVPLKKRTRGEKVQQTDDSQNSRENPTVSGLIGRRGQVSKSDDSQPTVDSQPSREEPKPRGRPKKIRQTDDSQPSHNSQNSQENSETRGRRVKVSKNDVQPTTSGVHEEPTREPRMKNQDDSQPAQNSQEDPETRGRRGKVSKTDVQPTSEVIQEKPKARGRPPKLKKTADPQPSTSTIQDSQDTQAETSDVKRSNRVRKKKLPFDELSIEKEKEVLAKKQERTTRKRGNTNLSVEYDLPLKNRRKDLPQEGFAAPTSPAVRIETKIRARDSTTSSMSSLDSSNRSASSSSLTRNKKKAEKVMFTGYSNKSMEALVKKLGGEMVNCPYSCSVLVTDQVRRTVKFLCALSRGVPIVSVKWLNSCRTTNAFTDPEEWILEDRDAEKKFSFNLETSLNEAKSNKFLDGWKVYVTASVKPVPSEMKMIVECSGGKFLSRAPASSSSSDKTFVVSCPEDRGQWVKLAKINRPPIVSAEALLSGVLQQKLDLKRHALS